MGYDDIVIGSGLTGLATVIGLPPERRVLVLGGPESGTLSHYAPGKGVPSAYLGFGGLGRFWHGVIPTGLRSVPQALSEDDFAKLFGYFYPATDIAARVGTPWLFVPKRPIRTPAAWRELQRARGDRLTIRHRLANEFATASSSVTVGTDGGSFSADRLWIAAGTVHTPRLIEASVPGFDGVRRRVSDHVIAYMGQIDRRRHPDVVAPIVERSPDGYWVRATFSDDGRGLFTRKPARFAYRRLDHGIEQRAAFGLPTGSLVAKLFRAASPGLVAEAMYNKFGLFPDADVLSVYAQVAVRDAHIFDAANAAIKTDVAAVRTAVDAVRADPAWPGLITPSRRPELYIHGIHLHHSVDTDILLNRGIGGADSLVQVVDAAVADDIGSEHHSFKLMAAAYAKARRSSSNHDASPSDFNRDAGVQCCRLHRADDRICPPPKPL